MRVGIKPPPGANFSLSVAARLRNPDATSRTCRAGPGWYRLPVARRTSGSVKTRWFDKRPADGLPDAWSLVMVPVARERRSASSVAAGDSFVAAALLHRYTVYLTSL